jgi:hypothetical protein
METKEWNKKRTTRKGTYGEKIIRKFFLNDGWVLYGPTKGIHAFDNIAIKNKIEVQIVEVKTKPRLIKFPATGIDKKHFSDYSLLNTKYNMRVFIVFVDQMLGTIYGNYLDILRENYIEDDISYPFYLDGRGGKDELIIFPLSKMIQIGKLTKYQIKKLNSLSI